MLWRMARVHHMDCCPLRPLGSGPIVSHCLLVEFADRLVLVDVGLGADDIASPARQLSRPWIALSRPTLADEHRAVVQAQQLGHDPRELRDVVCTHLDLDHAGGLGDVPEATAHVMRVEQETAMAARGIGPQSRRYGRAARGHGVWNLVDEGPTELEFHGRPAYAPIAGLEDELLLVPLPGHSRGHAGVAIRTGGDDWLLHAGDAYMVRESLDSPSDVPFGIAAFERTMSVDHAGGKASLEWLRSLARAGVRVFSSHDPRELAELRQATT